MSVLEAVAVLLAGAAAGAINTAVGSGSLITFPTLLAVGYSPIVANVSNNIGLVPGSVSGVVGYRRELAGQRGRILRLGAASLAGGTAGAVLLLLLPSEVFDAVVPVFIAIALVLVVVQPRMAARMAARQERAPDHGGRWAVGGVAGSGLYGGYFGAAQGIILLGVLGSTLEDDLQRVNALKNVLAGLVNGVAAVVFIAAADVAWGPVLLIAAGAIVGAQFGARLSRALSPVALRALIVAVGLSAIAQLVLR